MAPGSQKSLRTRTLLIGVCAATLLLVAALAVSTSSKAGAAQGAATPVRGGTITMARNADATNLDPYQTEDDPSIFTDMQIYDRLVQLSSNGKQILPQLATSWKYSKDHLTLTFQLRSGVRFSNGTPLKLQDVVFSLRRAVNPSAAWSFLFGPVKSVEPVGRHGVAVRTSQPFAPLLAAMTTFAASIYPKAYFNKVGATMAQHPIGSGAFKLSSWQPGKQLVLTRNPYYWQRGKPYLNKVVFNVVGDDNARVLQLQSKSVDLIDNVTPSQVAPLQKGGFRLFQVRGGQMQFIRFNNAVKPFDDPNVRCAMSYAADRATMAKDVYFGVGKPALSMMPSSTLYWDPKASPVTFDLAKAKSYLAKSSVPNGFSDTLLIKGGDPAYLSVAQIWAASLAKIGIHLTIQPVEPSQLGHLASTSQYHVAGLYFTNDTPDPDEITGILDYAVANALHTNFHDEQLHQMLVKARAELDAKKRAADYSAIQARANKLCVTVSTVDMPRLYAGSSKLRGYTPNPQGSYSFENVWKSK